MTGTTPPNRERQGAYRRGHWAERKAALWLLITGHRIVASRYKTASGEADLIARRRDLVVVAEVKARPTVRDCVEAVTPSAQRRIIAAAEIWQSRQRDGERLSIRFDIIAITPWRLPRHFKNMF